MLNVSSTFKLGSKRSFLAPVVHDWQEVSKKFRNSFGESIMDSNIENREKIRLDFLKRFLPRGLRSGHSLLFDFQSPFDFTPDKKQLEKCIEEYLFLLKDIPFGGFTEILGGRMLDASELVLAYLGRSNENDRLHLASDIVKELSLRIDTLLSDVKKFSEVIGRPYMAFDGCKRLHDIAWLLKHKSKGFYLTKELSP